jgi:hypothetical protein
MRENKEVKGSMSLRKESSNSMPWLEKAVQDLNRELNASTSTDQDSEQESHMKEYKATFLPRKRQT